MAGSGGGIAASIGSAMNTTISFVNVTATNSTAGALVVL
jgi:hypothetical protein